MCSRCQVSTDFMQSREVASGSRQLEFKTHLYTYVPVKFRGEYVEIRLTLDVVKTSSIVTKFLRYTFVANE